MKGRHSYGRSRSISERSLRQYLEEIGQFGIIDKKEEYALAKRIREKNDPAAKEKLIVSNLRIVVYICKRFLSHRISLSELINAGNEGLMHAVDKFDERKGYRFATYSVWWIKRAVYEAISAARGIVPKSRLARRIQSITPDFIQRKGREPTVNELAQVLKSEPGAVSLALAELVPPYSLDETFEQEDMETPYIETVRLDLEGANNLIAPAPDELFKRKIEKESLEKALCKLAPREQEVLKRNFGMDDYDVQSLEEISRMMNITRERVRQIRDNALRKLKNILAKSK
jgi:RNA polymerase primary sigma factor